jgi:hypothetical protein
MEHNLGTQAECSKSIPCGAAKCRWPPYRAIEKLVALAKREGVELRQSNLRVAKRAAIMAGRYTHV